MTENAALFWERQYDALATALRDAPAMPGAGSLKVIGESCAVQPGDMERGHEIARELVWDIPPVAECKAGAGAWDRMTGGAWRSRKEGQGDGS